MSSFIKKINEADAYAKSFKLGQFTGLELEERLLELGFYEVVIDPVTKQVSAKSEIVRFELGVYDA